MLTTLCPCGSGSPYQDCCEAFHRGIRFPLTAEALMRSRYSAYVFQLDDYLLKTRHPRNVQPHEAENIHQWARAVVFCGLEIVRVFQGQSADKTGKVEFKAHYRYQGQEELIHELSRFRRFEGRWYYWDGDRLN